MVRRKQGKKAEQQKRKTAELAMKRAEANARAQDVESDASDKNPGSCCADCLCAH
jgi:hypothetical protein